MKKLTHCSNCGNSILRYPTKTGLTYCNKYCKGQWQTKQREKLGYTHEWLYDQYFNQRKGADQIAREIGRDPKRVWEWLKNYGFELRPRGTDYGRHFKPGTQTMLGKKHKESTKEKIRQARIKDGHVPYLRNGKHWLKGTKGENHPSWKGGLTPERQSLYSSPEWSIAVKSVWKRDNATCQRCNKHQNQMRDKKFHIHHIESFMIREKRTELSNLVLLCPICHRFIHSKKNITKQFLR